MLGDPTVMTALITGGIVALVGFAIVIPILRRNPQRTLLAETTPKPRDPAIAASRALGLSRWQSGVLGPRDKDPAVLPYMGQHILALDGDRVVVRGGGGTHALRFVLLVAVLAPVLAAALMLMVLDILRFMGRSAGSCTTYTQTDTGITPVYEALPATVGGYFQEQACNFALIFDSNSVFPTLGAKLGALMALHGPLIVLILLPLLGLLLILRRTPAPLVFDRKRRVVYTYAKGALWMAPWEGLQMSVFGGPFTTAPAFALCKNGTGPARWFVLAGFHGRGEWRAPALAAIGLDWLHRWDGMRCWLAFYMERGPERIHGVFRGRGIGNLLAPREGKLPADLTNQIDALTLTRGPKADLPQSMTALMHHRDPMITAQEAGLSLG